MEHINYIKILITGFGAWLSVKLGILGPVLLALTGIMILDYITGVAASAKTGSISSKVGMWGIVKKLLYAIEVALGMLADWLILAISNSMGINLPIGTFFGLLVAIWLIGNEFASIIENFIKMGEPVPQFLIYLSKFFKVASEKAGNSLTDKLDNSLNDDNNSSL